MAETPRRKILVEYDMSRIAPRWGMALMVGLSFIASAHGYSRFHFGLVACNGGWSEAIVFLMGLVSAMGLIELLQWTAWRVVHRGEILSFQEREVLLGTSLIQNHTDSDQPKDYDLALSGGQLALAPVNPFGALLFGAVLLIIYLKIGTPNPCEIPNFGWLTLAGYFVPAYASLMFGSLLENQMKRNV